MSAFFLAVLPSPVSVSELNKILSRKNSRKLKQMGENHMTKSTCDHSKSIIVRVYFWIGLSIVRYF